MRTRSFPLLALLTLALASPTHAQFEDGVEEPEFVVPELPPPGKRLWLIESSLRRSLFQRKPWIAHQRGQFEVRPGLGHYTPDWTVEWAGLLDNAATDLGAIRPYDLTLDRNLDQDWIEAWVRAETILARSQAASRWSPVWYIERIRTVLLSVAETTALNDEQRRLQALGALRQVPDILQTAVNSLVSPARPFTEEALLRSVDLAAYIQTSLPRSLELGQWPEKDLKKFQRLSPQAIDAILRFRKWLEAEPLATGTPISGVGKENWQNVASQLIGIDINAQELRGSLLRDLVRLDRRLGAQRELKPTPKKWLQPARLAKRMRTVSETAAQVFVETGLIDRAALPKLQLIVDVRRGQGIPREIVRSSPDSEFGYRMWVESHGTSWTPEVAATRSALLSPACQDVLAARYGFPGEALWRSISVAHATTLQRGLWNTAAREGWGLYIMDLIGRQDSPVRTWRQEDTHDIALARFLLIEVARLIATIELHVEEVELEDAVTSFALRTGFDLDTAGFEVRHSMSDPLYGIGYLAYRELIAFEAELSKGREPRDAVTELIHAVLQRPSGRVRDLRTMLAATSER